MPTQTEITTVVPTGNAYDEQTASDPIEPRLMQRFLRTFESFLPAAAPSAVLAVGMGEGVRHRSQRSFRRQVGAHLEVEASASPFPLTTVSARIRCAAGP